MPQVGAQGSLAPCLLEPLLSSRQLPEGCSLLSAVAEFVSSCHAKALSFVHLAASFEQGPEPLVFSAQLGGELLQPAAQH